MADFGGFAQVIFVGISFIALKINKQIIAAKFIRSLYFVKKTKLPNLKL